MLFPMLNMFGTFTVALPAVSVCAVHNMTVLCSTLISCFPGTLLRNCLSDFEMVPVAPGFHYKVKIVACIAEQRVWLLL